MAEEKVVALSVGRSLLELKTSAIHYAQMKRNFALIHMEWGGVYKARVTFEDLKQLLGEEFVVLRRGLLVNAAQIHHLEDEAVLSSGERLRYVQRNKQELLSRLCALRGCAPEQLLLRRTREHRIAPITPVGEAELRDFPDGSYLSFFLKSKPMLVSVNDILYADADRNTTELHVSDGHVYRVRMPLSALERGLGESFIKVSRSRLVSALAIHSVTDTINLNSGEALDYTHSRRGDIRNRLAEGKRRFLDRGDCPGVPATPEEYRRHYACFEDAPFAFTDIEMVFDEDRRAVDWIFRYGNPALAKLEKMPLEKLIGSTFGSVFPNMDSKWLQSYEQAAVYGRTLEITEYSPEIDTNLKIICYPTFRGHCGCMLFSLDAPIGQLNSIQG